MLASSFANLQEFCFVCTQISHALASWVCNNCEMILQAALSCFADIQSTSHTTLSTHGQIEGERRMSNMGWGMITCAELQAPLLYVYSHWQLLALQ